MVSHLFGRPPTHFDSHQHQHLEDPVRSVLVETGLRLGVPVRDCTPGIVYRGDFYGQTSGGDPLPEAITVDALLGLLSSLPEGLPSSAVTRPPTRRKGQPTLQSVRSSWRCSATPV